MRKLVILARFALLLLGSLLALAGIRPEDAESNLVAWLQYIGVDKVRDLLGEQLADSWLLAIGLLLIFIGVLSFYFKRKPRNGYMPLSEAAQKVYEELRENDKNHWHIKLAERGHSVLKYFAIAISVNTDIYGKHPPSTKLEKLDSDEINGLGQFDDYANTFSNYQENEPKYIDLAIKNSSFRNIIRTLRAENDTPYSGAAIWIPVREAITYVMKWLSNHGSPLTDGDLMLEAIRKIRQAAFDGEVQLKGNKEANRDMTILGKFSDVKSMIPKEYWEHMTINPICVDTNSPDEPHTHVENCKHAIPNYMSIPKYFHVEIKQNDLLRKWV